jgi:peptidylprolyl isomerase
MSTVKNGDTVKVHYTGTLDSGEVFDSSKMEGREPFSFKIGEQSVIPGFENGIVGMTVGETKTINIPVDEAYGERDEKLLFEAPIERLPQGIEVGTKLQVMTPMGPQLAEVTSIGENVAMIDHNHPLAGKALNFEIEVLEIEQ